MKQLIGGSHWASICSSSFWAPSWTVYDTNETEIFRVKGPALLSKDANFFEVRDHGLNANFSDSSYLARLVQIVSKNGTRVGEYFFQSSREQMLNNPSPQNGIVCKFLGSILSPMFGQDLLILVTFGSVQADINVELKALLLGGFFLIVSY